MSQKLLRKSRNRHLLQLLPENLIPNKVIKRKTFKNKPVYNSRNIEQEICNQWVFSWKALNEQVQKSKDSFSGYQRYRHYSIDHAHKSINLVDTSTKSSHSSFTPGQVTTHRQMLLQMVFPVACVAGGEKEKINFLTSPAEHIVEYYVTQVVGGNLLGHLSRYVHQQYSIDAPVEKPRKNQCVSSACVLLRTKGLLEKKYDCVKAENTNLKVMRPFPSEATVETFAFLPSVWKLGNMYVYADFSIKWGGQFLSIADALIRQRCWNKIYSLAELQGARDRIGDQRKKEYMERRKISILYGNLSKRILVRVMRAVIQQGGDTNEKFLSTLERRLDVVLKRMLFFSTIESARQWIRQGKILVNNNICTSAGCLLQPGDFVAITKRARAAWRKSWFIHVDPNRKSAEKMTFSASGRPTIGIIQTGQSEKMGLCNRREFIFTPPLMRKLHRWGKLWGNLVAEGHRWTRSSGTCGMKKSLHTFFTNSSLNLYLALRNPDKTLLPSFHTEGRNAKALSRQAAQVTQRRKTRCTNWFKKYLTTIPKVGRNIATQNFASSNVHRKLRGGLTIPLHSEGSQVGTTVFLRKKQLLRDKILTAMVLHRNAGHVVDGLYSYRCNRAFALRKSNNEKRQGWQFTFCKPMHVECCYKQGSAIFLYAPQMLVWPCNINISLLKQALVKK